MKMYSLPNGLIDPLTITLAFDLHHIFLSK